MFIQTEATPNPATLKFLPGRQVLASGTADYRTNDEAEASPLAQRLFEIKHTSHRAFSNFSYLGLYPAHLSQLINEFAFDEGGIHIHA